MLKANELLNRVVISTKTLLICLIVSLTTSCSAALITPVASVIGATASVTSAYLNITDEYEITVYTRECLWYRKVKLSDEGKKLLPRSDKIQIVANNLKDKKFCPQRGED